ncbi:5-oxoprolinase subunit PxpA [Clostridium sp. MCC353]|uniref:LamB/YcsF family protein n=1 Tax=Clostridium sp. MCC353 TaxID=2592646 RepID=UPI001C027822|nr:5-oxoprolinase subunit PxpA [Clostridium sp. MCC353]MBT9775637.1 5-oxoprolinase subunit PxpA [Clostridium sp. MCC353]
MFRIDLNSDLGESFGAYRMEGDEEIIKYVTSVNVACGWHAGDPMVMDRTVKLAKKYGAGIGAHPGYPDLMGFGRRKMILSPMEIKNYMKYQIGALDAFVRSEGLKMQHVAPHGALGNACQYDREISRAICEAVCEVDKELMIYYCAGAVLGQEARRMGLQTASEIFADRAYEEDLSLVPRSRPGSMITDEEEAVLRSIRMIKEGKVTTIGGKDVDIKGDTLCVHGDGPKAMEFVKKICRALAGEGIELKNIKQ